MVSFDLEEIAIGQYCINPTSIKELHLGFEGRKKSYVRVQPSG